jgi:hypothetical protein
MSNQTRLVSLIETFCNIGSGFLLSLVVWQALAAALDIPMPIETNVLITSVFTVVSITRSYLWRRFFATGLHETVARWVRQ